MRSLMEQEKMLNKEEPVMVLKYSAPRVALFVLVALIVPLAYLTTYDRLNEVAGSLYEYYFMKYGGLFFTIFAIWLIIDLLNTKQIEVYMDRIVRRVWIDVPFLREKTFYFKEIYFMPIWSGLFIARKIGWFYTKGPRFFFHTSRLKREDEIRLAEFLSQISGKNKDIFLYRPIFGSKSYKLIEEESYGAGKQ